ncbi:MAG: DUF6279 family lipoprotein [Leptospiraceae bacterium]|nr:DUF6279 family lipoprotein [Leptospiraceae bacterium]MDW8305890.1 DUF6279 family lipoprotein [Leptospiraceae bacterium]
MVFRKYSRRGCLVLLILLFFSHCTGFLLRIGYQNLDIFLYRRIDNYFDLNAEQKAWVKAKLKDFLTWHRSQELVHYIAILDEVIGYAKDGFILEEIEIIWRKVEERRDILAAQLIPDAAYFLKTLTEEQIRHFEEKVEKETKELEEEENLPLEKQEQRRMDRYLTNYEEWYGSLSKEQRDNLIFLAKKVPPLRKGLAAFRRQRMNEFLAHLRQKREDVNATAALLRRYFIKPIENYPPERREHMLAFVTSFKKFLVEADQLATYEQRANLLENLEKWRNRLRDLAFNP